jgi:hypothetical protein
MFPAGVHSVAPDAALDARPGNDLLRGRAQGQVTLARIDARVDFDADTVNPPTGETPD